MVKNAIENAVENAVENVVENAVKNTTSKTGETSKRATSTWSKTRLQRRGRLWREQLQLSRKRGQKCCQKCDFKDGRDFEESNFKERTDDCATSKRGRTTVRFRKEVDRATSMRGRPRNFENNYCYYDFWKRTEFLKFNWLWFPIIWSQVLKKMWSVIFVKKFYLKHKFINIASHVVNRHVWAVSSRYYNNIYFLIHSFFISPENEKYAIFFNFQARRSLLDNIYSNMWLFISPWERNVRNLLQFPCQEFLPLKTHGSESAWESLHSTLQNRPIDLFFFCEISEALSEGGVVVYRISEPDDQEISEAFSEGVPDQSICMVVYPLIDSSHVPVWISNLWPEILLKMREPIYYLCYLYYRYYSRVVQP